MLATVLAGAALAKLANPRAGRQAFASYGIGGGRAQALLWSAAIALELALAAGVAAGYEPALAGGLALALAGAGVNALTFARGRGGRPCPCFGARTRITRGAVARDLALAAGMAVALAAPIHQPTRDEWVAIGLVAALGLSAGLAVVVAALAREVGMLRMRVGPSAALEIPEEGPPLGSELALSEGFAGGRVELLLAVFLSPACRVCEALRPTVEAIRASERVEVRTFEETTDTLAWAEARVPGSPYAVAMSPAGAVLAKGTFNNLAQLEGLLGVAEQRSGPAVMERTGV